MSVIKGSLLIFLGLLSMSSALPAAHRTKRQDVVFEDDFASNRRPPNQGTDTIKALFPNAGPRAEDRIRDSRSPHWDSEDPPFSPSWGPMGYPHHKHGHGFHDEKFGPPNFGPPNFGPGYHDDSFPRFGFPSADLSFHHSPEFHGGSDPRGNEGRSPKRGEIVFPGDQEDEEGPVNWNGGRKQKSIAWNKESVKESPVAVGGTRPGSNVAGDWNGSPQQDWISLGDESSWNDNTNGGNRPRPSSPSNSGGSWNGNIQRPSGTGVDSGAWNGNGDNNQKAWNGNNQRPSGNGGDSGPWNGFGKGGKAWNGNNQRPDGGNQGPNWSFDGGAWNGNSQRPHGGNQGPNWSFDGGAWNGNNQRPSVNSGGAWNGGNNGGAWNGDQRPSGSQFGGESTRPDWNTNAAGGFNNQGPNNVGGNTIDTPPSSGSNTKPSNSGSKFRPAITIAGSRPPSTPAPPCNCQFTSDYNPVCGTDNVTYINARKLRCAQRCGQAVSMKHLGTCSAPPTALRRKVA